MDLFWTIESVSRRRADSSARRPKSNYGAFAMVHLRKTTIWVDKAVSQAGAGSSSSSSSSTHQQRGPCEPRARHSGSALALSRADPKHGQPPHVQQSRRCCGFSQRIRAHNQKRLQAVGWQLLVNSKFQTVDRVGACLISSGHSNLTPWGIQSGHCRQPDASPLWLVELTVRGAGSVGSLPVARRLPLPSSIIHRTGFDCPAPRDLIDVNYGTGGGWVLLPTSRLQLLSCVQQQPIWIKAVFAPPLPTRCPVRVRRA
ncbi:hypothetical protein B0T26DRAFT_337083 [Lasiosphaeria miniovina]|uniref:Uncharacterized protein n=1 Tax=Lasiosphaeria miniovina TaxID=1954250 RepID=A0AA40AAR1_9PEZI|nr:uncharacterized protein B0T26DRAFT_337083 [Lasiosphaeria miniovina]KAK0712409.1 hypothetical protein B0T26DRAFT_337083 [Lasiosphaeria miniovina]